MIENLIKKLEQGLYARKLKDNPIAHLSINQLAKNNLDTIYTEDELYNESLTIIRNVISRNQTLDTGYLLLEKLSHGEFSNIDFKNAELNYDRYLLEKEPIGLITQKIMEFYNIENNN